MKAYWLSLTFALAVSAPASKPALPAAAPSADFSLAISPFLKQHLSIALLELAFGDPNKARSHARIAAMPERLNVYLDASQVPAERGEQLTSWARESLNLWSETGSTLIEETFDKAQANVVVVFSDVVNGRRGVLAGYNSTQRISRYGGGISTTTISSLVEISNRAPGGGLTTQNQVRKALGHEFGHILGLQDSKDVNDLMGPVPIRGASTFVDSRSSRALQELTLRANAIIDAAPAFDPRAEVPRVFNFAEPR